MKLWAKIYIVPIQLSSSTTEVTLTFLMHCTIRLSAGTFSFISLIKGLLFALYMEPWLTNCMELVICHQNFLQIFLIVKAQMPLFLYSELEPCCFIFGEISIFTGPIVCCILNGFTKVCIKSTMNLTIRILSLVSLLIKGFYNHLLCWSEYLPSEFWCLLLFWKEFQLKKFEK